MNSRHARRLATTRLAAAARVLASDADGVDELNAADRLRMRRAFDDLAHELEVRAGVVPRIPRPDPVDPDQGHLFPVDQEVPK